MTDAKEKTYVRGSRRFQSPHHIKDTYGWGN